MLYETKASKISSNFPVQTNVRQMWNNITGARGHIRDLVKYLPIFSYDPIRLQYLIYSSSILDPINGYTSCVFATPEFFNIMPDMKYILRRSRSFLLGDMLFNIWRTCFFIRFHISRTGSVQLYFR